MTEITIYPCTYEEWCYTPERVCLACGVAGCECDEVISGCEEDQD